jgi:hypothetical protein
MHSISLFDCGVSHLVDILRGAGGVHSWTTKTLSYSRMKALLFTLVRAFEFELAVPAEEIVKKSSIVQRPFVVSDPGGGYQLPLLVRPHRDS